MAQCGASCEQSSPKLSELFDSIWKDYELLEDSNDPSNSSVIQSKLQQAIEKAEKAVHMVNDLSLFSTNENLEEVSSNEIKYILLPALLGYFMNRSLKESRFETLKKVQIYFIDFIRLCKLYGVTSVNVPKPYSPTEKDDKIETQQQPKIQLGPATLEEQTRKRQMKIERFKSQKELERNLKELYEIVKKEKSTDCDSALIPMLCVHG